MVLSPLAMSKTKKYNFTLKILINHLSKNSNNKQMEIIQKAKSKKQKMEEELSEKSIYRII